MDFPCLPEFRRCVIRVICVLRFRVVAQTRNFRLHLLLHDYFLIILSFFCLGQAMQMEHATWHLTITTIGVMTVIIIINGLTTWWWMPALTAVPSFLVSDEESLKSAFFKPFWAISSNVKPMFAGALLLRFYTRSFLFWLLLEKKRKARRWFCIKHQVDK